jgi:hypothetical protein
VVLYAVIAHHLVVSVLTITVKYGAQNVRVFYDLNIVPYCNIISLLFGHDTVNFLHVALNCSSSNF